MKNSFYLLFAAISTLESCQAAGEIFKAGVGVGVFISVLAVALVIFAIVKIGKKNE